MRYILQVAFRAAAVIGVFFATTYFLPAVQHRQFATSWWQENRIKLQRCMLGQGRDAVVVTGSSLTANLPAQAFPGKFLNLSLVGGSPLTGLECLVRSGDVPAVVLVETNWLDRGADHTSLRWECNPLLAWMRRRMPGFLAANQPLNLLAGILDRFAHPLNAPPPVPLDPQFFEQRIHRDELEYQASVDEGLLDKNIKDAAALISQLQARGATVMLFESPVDARLSSTRKYAAIRSAIDRQFAKSGVRRIPQFPEVLPTSDGNHLRKQGLDIYAAYLSHQVALASGRTP